MQKNTEYELTHFPFYIYEGKDYQTVLSRIHVRILSYLQKNVDTNYNLNLFKQGHPDLLIMNPSSASGQYVVDDLKEFFQFILLSPNQWPTRFVIVESAHRVTERICNKLLKVLEDPCPGARKQNINIFFVCTQSNHFTPTIISRACRIKVDGEDLDSSDKGDEFDQLLAKVLNDRIQNPRSYQDFDQLLNIIKYSHRAKIFNIPIKERISLLNSYFYETVKN